MSTANLLRRETGFPGEPLRPLLGCCKYRAGSQHKFAQPRMYFRSLGDPTNYSPTGGAGTGG
jgi:hypothetical protein